MGNLGDILKGHAKRHGITRQLEAVGVVELATAEIEKIVPCDDFEVISFKDGVLKIWVGSAPASSEINLAFSRDLKKKLAIKRIITTGQKPSRHPEDI